MTWETEALGAVKMYLCLYNKKGLVLTFQKSVFFKWGLVLIPLSFLHIDELSLILYMLEALFFILVLIWLFIKKMLFIFLHFTEHYLFGS